jgi:RNA polymerase sigma factor (sigma-70 family)
MQYAMMLFGKKNYTEEELVAACVRNERRAQEVFYRRFFPEMHKMCLRYTHDDTVVIEIINNGFLRVFKKLDTFEFKGSLEGWVRRLVYHSMADYFRQHSKYVHFLVLEDAEADLNEKAQWFDTGETNDILGMVKNLPPVSQDVFRLYAIEGYSHVEIANHLSISEGTSKWHLSMARQQLRTQLEAVGYTIRRKKEQTA